MRRIRESLGTLGAITVVVLWLAVTFAIIEGCSALIGDWSCDPTAQHCDTPSGSGPGNK